MAFRDVKNGPPDVMYHIKVMADMDKSPNSVDLGVGIYRNEQGTYNEMETLKRVCGKTKLVDNYDTTDFSSGKSDTEFPKS